MIGQQVPHVVYVICSAWLEAGLRQAETSVGGLEPTGLLHSLAFPLSFDGDK